jgi:hypothetical protein
LAAFLALGILLGARLLGDQAPSETCITPWDIRAFNVRLDVFVLKIGAHTSIEVHPIHPAPAVRVTVETGGVAYNAAPLAPMDLKKIRQAFGSDCYDLFRLDQSGAVRPFFGAELKLLFLYTGALFIAHVYLLLIN